MQKNLLSNERDSLLKRLSNNLKNKNLKKSLIRTMAGLGTAAILLTSTACDESSINYEDTNPTIENTEHVNTDTNNINKETENTDTTIETITPNIDNNSDSSYEIPSLTKYKAKDYTSTIGKSLLNNNEAKTKEKEFKTWYKDNEISGLSFDKMFNDLNLHPLCYDFFREYYGDNATDTEIQQKAKIACQFVDVDGNLYVQYYFLNNSNDLETEIAWVMGKFNSALLKFNLPKDVSNDLVNSGLSQDNAKNLILLKYIVNNYDYEVLAKEIYNNNVNGNHDVSYIEGKTSKPVYDRAVSSVANLEDKVTTTYVLANYDDNDSTKHCLYSVKKKMSEMDINKITSAGNDDYNEYPNINATKRIKIYSDNLPEDYIDISKKDILYIGDYEDYAYWGVDYTWEN